MKRKHSLTTSQNDDRNSQSQIQRVNSIDKYT